ncbi:Protein phosphatase 2C containing protein [Ectocarpus siliculosus]|uniref:Protein phosphatase 2C containing protein n=1 Tax=Ectocarpus siliculosus TaxID=2880 RepID=D8LNX2_ECTSI|nr:Protein phosphatase 2C containing protein [Ectocarpus siliculosus]|eukprot:CBN78332.1 Protein phosphatase 2C containing protein [Ectocarpus siliculosus]
MGLKPNNPRWENQDNYVMKEDLGGLGVRLFVVLDGHGELGHLVSRRCSAKLPNLVVDSNLCVARATLRMADDLRSCPVDCASSGATCVLTTIRDGKISVANLGDSKCVLARLVNGQVCAVPLSHDHKPDRPDERQRILAIGGQVGSRHLVVGSNPSGPIRIPMGPARVWYRCRGEIMGLAMSRSLGDDIAHQAGVSSEPEVKEHQIDANDQFLILATDGVWDVTEIGQAVQIVQGYASRCRGNSWDPQGAASLLAHSARKRWEGLSAVVDDITALVVRLTVP